VSSIEAPLAGLVGRSWQRLRSATDRPGRLLDAVLVVCWLILLSMWAMHRQADHHSASGPDGTSPALARWVVMVGAMMLPIVVPQATMLARRGLRRRRHQAVTSFALAYLAVWTLVGLVLIRLAHVFGVAGGGPVMLCLLAAAGWHCAAPRRAAVRQCGQVPTVALAGIRAHVDCLGAGVLAGGTAVWTCGPAMMAMAFTHAPVVAVGVSAALLAEHRPGPNPEARIGSAAQAGSLVMLAGLVGVAAGWPATGALL
jgi:Predicted metal-binding integral membrane protein (DUF2182)